MLVPPFVNAAESEGSESGFERFFVGGPLDVVTVTSDAALLWGASANAFVWLMSWWADVLTWWKYLSDCVV